MPKKSSWMPFVKVRENFKIVLDHLFNDEDTCDLIITDPDNPLNRISTSSPGQKGKDPYLLINFQEERKHSLPPLSYFLCTY